MPKSPIVVALSLAVSLTVAPGFGVTPALTAQGAPPPEPGTIIVEDPLAAPGMVQVGVSPNGRNGNEFVGEGFIMKVRGKATDTAAAAISGALIRGLTVTDGEVRAEVKAVSGAERARFRLIFRAQPGEGGYYAAAVEPARGLGQILKWADGGETVLAESADPAGWAAPDDWNAVAVRTRGPDLWLLVNDRVIASASDPSYETGNASVRLERLGDLNDEQESAVVVRNFRASALAGGEPARPPAYPELQEAVALPPAPRCSAVTPTPLIALTPRALELPPVLSAFVGAWEGHWGGRLPSRLVIEEIDARRAIVVYAWGDFGNVRGGWARDNARALPDGRLEWGTGVRFSFTMRGDLSGVDGTREAGGSTDRISMTRCSLGG